MLYAEGGVHSVRRWLGAVQLRVPNLDQRLSQILAASLQSGFPGSQKSRQYQLLCLLATQRVINQDQAKQIIQLLSVEVLFEMAKTEGLTFDFQENEALLPRLTLLNVAELMSEAYDNIQDWDQCQLPAVYLTQVPTLNNPRELQAVLPERAVSQWRKLLQPGLPLRELAPKVNKSPAEMAHLLTPLLQRGLLTMAPLADKSLILAGDPPPNTAPPEPIQAEPLIACIDDSEIICESIKRIVRGAGYRFVGIQDPLSALTTLLAQPPDLIFLDLVMPGTNGYEICSRLRKISRFSQIPIIILTGNDGIIDRMRARLVGSTHFLTKPVDPELVVETIQAYVVLPTTVDPPPGHT
jgi:chemotaxis family two-component system response regulator PixG